MNTTKVQLRTLLQKRKKGFSHAAQIAITTVAAIGIVGAVIANQEGIIGGAAQIPGIAVSGLNAYIQGDKLIVEGTARNTGNVIFSSVLMENLRGGHLTLTQDTTIFNGGLSSTHGDVTMNAKNGATTPGNCVINIVDKTTSGGSAIVSGTSTGTAGTGTAGNFDGTCNGDPITPELSSAIRFVGLTTPDGSTGASGLEAAQSQRFRITIDQGDFTSSTAQSIKDVSYSLSETVPIGTKLTVTLFATDGVTIASSTPKIVSVGR